MIHEPNDLEVGKTVYLYPQSKTASRNVQRMLTVTVMKNPAQHWPMVVVGWKENGADLWELVHRDNIRLRSPAARNKADDKQGDSARDVSSSPTKVRRMPGRAIGIIEGEETLW